MVAEDKFEPVGFKLPLASLIHDRFVAALACGLGEVDWAGMARISYRQAGLTSD